MLAEPIEFRILQSLQTALKGISVSAGYHHTVAGMAVKLDPDHQVEDLIPGANEPIGPPRPWMVLEFTEAEPPEYSPANQMLIKTPFIVHAIHDTDPSDDGAKLRTFHRLCADVEQAIAVDITRGGLVTDTRVLGRRLRDREGQEVWAEVSGEVRYRRTYGAPNG